MWKANLFTLITKMTHLNYRQVLTNKLQGYYPKALIEKADIGRLMKLKDQLLADMEVADMLGNKKWEKYKLYKHGDIGIKELLDL